MSLEIGLRYLEAKDFIVGNLVKAYIIEKESDGSVRFQEVFAEMTGPHRKDDFKSRLCRCYSCLEKVIPDMPLMMLDDVGTTCPFHDLCLYNDCLIRIKEGDVRPVLLGKLN